MTRRRQWRRADSDAAVGPRGVLLLNRSLSCELRNVVSGPRRPIQVEIKPLRNGSVCLLAVVVQLTLLADCVRGGARRSRIVLLRLFRLIPQIQLPVSLCVGGGGGALPPVNGEAFHFALH